MRQPLRSPTPGRRHCPIAAKGRGGEAAIGPCTRPGAAGSAERGYIAGGGHACRGIARGTPPPTPTQQPCLPAQPLRYMGPRVGLIGCGPGVSRAAAASGAPGRPRGASPPPPTAGAASCLRLGPRAWSGAPTAGVTRLAGPTCSTRFLWRAPALQDDVAGPGP